MSLQALLSFSLVFVQYLIPCAMVTVCYISICRYIVNRPVLANSARQRKILSKRRRNNRMLIVVSVAHFVSWLPLNVINVIMTTLDSEDEPLFEDMEDLFIVYAICHIGSMTCAISNPVLYGFMNENFREEFRKIWKKVRRALTVRKDNNQLENQDEDLNIPMSIFGRVNASENMVTVAPPSCTGNIPESEV